MKTSTEPTLEPQSTQATAAPRPVKSSLKPLFQTWIYQCQEGPKHLNERLEELTYRLMQDEKNSTRRTNVGGWHYAFDFFKLEESVVERISAT